MPKRSYRKKRFVRKRYGKVARTKQLVTGHGPSLLDKIAGGVGSVASLAKAVMPAIMAINTERKYLDSNVSGRAYSNGSLYCLTNMAQGTDENNRIGNSILAKDLNIKLSCYMDTTLHTHSMIRCLIIVDKQQQGVPPTMASIFQNVSGGIIDMLSPLNRNFTDRYILLHDGHFPQTQNSNEIVFQKWFNKLDFHIRYIGTSSANASLGNNNIYVVFLSELPTSDTSAPILTLYARLNFTDN